MKIRLLLIDFQDGFLKDENYTPYLPGGNMNLCVPGAVEDAERVSTLIRRGKDKWDDIHMTMDSHNVIHIASPIFWVDKQGNHPNPFTLISAKSVLDGDWKASNYALQAYALEYVKQLEMNGRYMLVIWPPHCIIGTAGHNIYAPLRQAVAEWEMNFSIVDAVTKGSNYKTEHYSALEADVPDPSDPTSQLNIRLVQSLEDCDFLAIAGEARSHCVASTVRSIVNNFSDTTSRSKVVLLEDCMRDVPGFEQQGQDFMNEMRSLGVKIENSVNFL